LPHRPDSGHIPRPAAQSGQIRDSGVGPFKLEDQASVYSCDGNSPYFEWIL
jgi:hypothetical protein